MGVRRFLGSQLLHVGVSVLVGDRSGVPVEGVPHPAIKDVHPCRSWFHRAMGVPFVRIGVEANLEESLETGFALAAIIHELALVESLLGGLGDDTNAIKLGHRGSSGSSGLVG